MLSEKAEKKETITAKDETKDQLNSHGFSFKLSSLSPNGKTDLDFYGSPELCKQSGFEASNARSFDSKENHFSIGLGAIGDSFDDCKNRFGEYMMLGKNIAYLPADGSRKPDGVCAAPRLRWGPAVWARRRGGWEVRSAPIPRCRLVWRCYSLATSTFLGASRPRMPRLRT